ncbi:28S ribosomal protein s24, mitochondrial [Plakobranchus ocellatus]|uniref:28S ribosomal protein s24, mitochondrial n=1 Tax=Plakobranchus ocellatus TaxID=259542 RepID=A0AAV4D443_9GAST|nr:28S ribosomal protein s24, mitochondrial [Plakobranchus ocellatus]
MSFHHLLARSRPFSSSFLCSRGIFSTASLNKNRKSGVPKITPFRTKPLTYEEAVPPSRINVRKGWLSFNTTNLHEEKRAGETTFEDFLVRRFLIGTWHRSLASEVVIKRRHNMVILSFLVSMERLLPRQVYFLQGYTERLLSGWLKMPVKVELQTVASQRDMVFKKI